MAGPFWLLDALKACKSTNVSRERYGADSLTPKLVKLRLFYEDHKAAVGFIKVHIKALDMPEKSSCGLPPAAVGVKFEVCSTSEVDHVCLKLNYRHSAGKKTITELIWLQQDQILTSLVSHLYFLRHDFKLGTANPEEYTSKPEKRQDSECF